MQKLRDMSNFLLYIFVQINCIQRSHENRADKPDAGLIYDAKDQCPMLLMDYFCVLWDQFSGSRAHPQALLSSFFS